MYRCGVCGACSEPGQARKVWIVERHIPHVSKAWDGDEVRTTRTEIEREIPVCHSCYKCLTDGSELEELREFYRTRPGPVQLDEWPEEVGRKGHR